MFQVDQILIMHSPYTDEDTRVVYRGRFGVDQSVVYNPVTGWQGAIPTSWLSPDESFPGDEPEPAGRIIDRDNWLPEDNDW